MIGRYVNGGRPQIRQWPPYMGRQRCCDQSQPKGRVCNSFYKWKIIGPMHSQPWLSDKTFRDGYCAYSLNEQNAVVMSYREVKSICCNSYAVNTSMYMIRSPPRPPDLLRICLGSAEHFGRDSISYYNVLALGAIGVYNLDIEWHGFENWHWGKLLSNKMFWLINGHVTETTQWNYTWRNITHPTTHFKKASNHSNTAWSLFKPCVPISTPKLRIWAGNRWLYLPNP